MAKQVTQETFDDVVKENIEEFDMSVEEALADAVQQFETQVSLQLFQDIVYVHVCKETLNIS